MAPKRKASAAPATSVSQEATQDVRVTYRGGQRSSDPFAFPSPKQTKSAPAKTAPIAVYKPKSAPPARTPKRRVVASESESDAESDAGASASDDGASDVSEQVTARSSKAGSKGKAKGKPKAKAPVAMRKVPPKLPEVEPAVADGLQELGKHLVAALPSREPLELYSQRTLTRHDKTRTAFTIAKVGADHVLLPLIATCSVGKDGDRRRARLAGQSSLMQVLRAKGLADRVSSQFLAVDGLRTERCSVAGDITLLYDPAKQTVRVSCPITFTTDE